MLRHAKTLIGLRLGAEDGQIGHVQDFLFDDQSWTVRYLVADTGQWLPGRQVIISPFSVMSMDETSGVVKVGLTRAQIEGAPAVETHMTVSRRHEIEVARYYGWPMYWYGPALWGPTPFPMFEITPEAQGRTEPAIAPEQEANPHLRSTSEVAGYHVQTRDAELGHVEDFIMESTDWSIRYLVIDTRNWWPGKKVLIACPWIQKVSWDESKVFVDLPRESITQAPTYDPGVPISPEYESELLNHYAKVGAPGAKYASTS